MMRPPTWDDLSAKDQQVLLQIIRGAVPIATDATLARLAQLGLTEKSNSRIVATSIGQALASGRFESTG